MNKNGQVLRLATALAIAALSGAAFGQQPSIAGTWEWTSKKSGCSEQYVFRDNGTVSIKRGDEQTENSYLMSWAPESSGRYKLTITTLKDNGGRDCDGAADDSTGRRSVVYVLFSQSRESMIHCGSPAGTDCTGLMKRTAR
jgi:hypothetical protein